MIQVVPEVTILLLEFGEQTKMSLICISYQLNALLVTALPSHVRPVIVPVVIIVSVTVKKVGT